MSYEAVVYFAGPQTKWAKKVSEHEVIFRREYRWRWMARWMARSVHRSLDPSRCGFAVMDEFGTELEHVQFDELLSPEA